MRGMAREYAAGNARGPGWREFAGTLGQSQAGRQAGSGMARSRAKAGVNWDSQGQRRGRCRVRRRAERVIRPAREKNRRRRVLVVAICSPRPIRAVQRARLWAITCTASQAPLAAEAAGRHVVQTDAVLEVSNGVLDLGVTAMIGLQLQRLPIAVGDEAVIAVSGEEGELGTGRRLHPPDNEPHRRGVRLGLERGVSRLGNIGGAVHPVGNGSPVLLRYRLDQVPQAFVLADGDGEADIHLTTGGDESVGVEAAVGPRRKLPAGPGTAHPGSPFHAGSGRRPERCWCGPRAAGTSALRRCRRRWPTAGDSPACRYSRGGVPPPWPVRRSRRWWSPGQWSGARRRVPPRPATPGPATRGSPSRVDGRGPTGSCAGRCPGWMAP